MDFRDVVTTRRSRRKFADDPPSPEVVTRVLKMAQLAPTWANMQGVRYVVVRDPDQVAALADAIGQKWAHNAPMFVVACIKPSDSGKNTNGLQYFMVDAAIGMEHLVLAATDEGLGTCWIGWFDEEAVKALLEVPEKTRVVAITPLGTPKGTPKPQTRKSLEKLAFTERFGTPWPE